jgi:hypothetical protein
VCAAWIAADKRVIGPLVARAVHVPQLASSSLVLAALAAAAPTRARVLLGELEPFLRAPRDAAAQQRTRRALDVLLRAAHRPGAHWQGAELSPSWLALLALGRDGDDETAATVLLVLVMLLPSVVVARTSEGATGVATRPLANMERLFELLCATLARGAAPSRLPPWRSVSEQALPSSSSSSSSSSSAAAAAPRASAHRSVHSSSSSPRPVVRRRRRCRRARADAPRPRRRRQ